MPITDSLALLQEKGFPCGTWIALDMSTFRRGTNFLRKYGRYFDGAKLHFSSEDNLKDKQQRARRAGAKKTWWDRKGHDTAGTVRGIVRTAINCGFDRVTIHISNDYEVMYAALDEAQGDIEIIGITVLTSVETEEAGIQYGMPIASAVLLRARMAAHVGLDGVVCSPQEVAMLHRHRSYSKVARRNLELDGLRLVIPGTRTTTSELGGQRRPASAIDVYRDAGGVELDLVFGGEVYGAKDPEATLAEICSMLWTQDSLMRA